MKTETENTIIDILSEDFIISDCNCDLQELIDNCIEYYTSMALCRSKTKEYRLKLNELIQEYNERRDMKIYNFIK